MVLGLCKSSYLHINAHMIFQILFLLCFKHETYTSHHREVLRDPTVDQFGSMHDDENEMGVKELGGLRQVRYGEYKVGYMRGQ